MTGYRILIVDDQSEMRRLFRAGLESLGSELEIVDVPSGEEALLEVGRQTIDLLVSDIRLAGMSGLELKQKIQARIPGLKVILFTGLTDPQLRQQAANAGADAFFLKPVKMADFLDAVERCLGLVETASPMPLLEEEPLTEPPQGLSERLTALRHELSAISTILLDDRGRLLAMAGDLPDAGIESALLPSLMAAFSASGKVSQLVGMTSPEDLLCLAGSNYDLFLAHVGQSYALLVIANKGPGSEYLGTTGFSIRLAVRDLLAILMNLGIPLQPHEEIYPDTAVIESEPAVEAAASELEALFHPRQRKPIDPEEVDAFWDSMAKDEEISDVLNADALTYDQARQLGLTPDDIEV